jgi:predicted transcriptional regulator
MKALRLIESTPKDAKYLGLWNLDLLRDEIIRAKLTYVEIARRTGVDQRTVADILMGRTDPRVSWLAAMAAMVGLTMIELFDNGICSCSEREWVEREIQRFTPRP